MENKINERAGSGERVDVHEEVVDEACFFHPLEISENEEVLSFEENWEGGL